VEELDVKNQIGGYVFVVCGSKEHLDTLALSYSVLEKKTKYPIYVITDNSRNEYLLRYPQLINIQTPSELDHHQASIWLKTSLHRLLPSDKLYAYLDTDILAYGKHPDGIFDQYKSPIIFAPDHCKMPQFSSYAVICGCMDMFEKKRKEVNELLKKHDPLSQSNDPQIISKREELFKIFQQSKTNGKLPFKFYLRYFSSWPVFWINNEFKLDQRKKIWFDSAGQPVMHKINMRMIAKKAGLKWNYLRNEITLPDGRNLYSNFCSHLSKQIKNKFGIEITDANWQHWNGGVFIFGPQSSDFMNTWHQFTMEIFKDKEWKTRDQGTLIATVWKSGLQDHLTLSKKWNLILDYFYPVLQVRDDRKITIDGNEWIDPEFVHIYHHWGDTSWEVWNKVAVNLST
jgi:hypothetical protein